MAFICYNTLNGHTEFVVRVPTPVGRDGATKVWHYSRIHALSLFVTHALPFLAGIAVLAQGANEKIA